jgi:apolipoprotein D and lipocalin family protein
VRSCVALALAATAAFALPPVDQVELLRYIGRWYQVYSDIETSLFESRYCVVADYGVFANGTVSVRNRDRVGSVTGAQNGIRGYATLNNRTSLSTASGALSVFLQLPAPAPQGIAAPYDIVFLGPPGDKDGLYEWAVVSDPFSISLFVLTRDVDVFFKRYNATVFDLLKDNGFDHFLNQPIQTYDNGCPPDPLTDLVSFARASERAHLRTRARPHTLTPFLPSQWTCDVHDRT